MIKIDDYIIDKSTGWFVKDIQINTTKDVRRINLNYKHGNVNNQPAYFSGLEIIISGKTNISLVEKSTFFDKINYGLHLLTFNDDTYFVENTMIVFQKSVNNPLLEEFNLTFVSYSPYKYNLLNKIEIEKNINNSTTIFYSNNDIKMHLDDVNFQFSVTSITEICLRNYKIMSLTDDVNGSKYPTVENILTNFSENGNSICAVFETTTYIRDFYLLFDSVTSYNLFKTDIKIFYFDKNGNIFRNVLNDFSFSIEENNIYRGKSKLYHFENINVETKILKIVFIGNITKKYNYTSDFTKKNLAIIIPNSHSYLYVPNSGKYFVNSNKEMVLKNGIINNSAIVGEIFNIYPKTTYAFSTNPITLKCNFINYNFYGVEHV